VYNESLYRTYIRLKLNVELVYMGKYVGPISSCIFILKILLAYTYVKGHLKTNFNVGVTFFFYSVIKMGKYSTRLLPSSVVNIST
jgi:hypothetical protein